MKNEIVTREEKSCTHVDFLQYDVDGNQIKRGKYIVVERTILIPVEEVK